MAPWLRRLAREPVVHFALGAALLVSLDRALTAHRTRADTRPTITVTARDLDALRERFRSTTGRAPGAADDRALVDGFVRDEALVREARARGLDRDDPAVRDRLRQVMRFVLDAQPVDEPDDTALAAWMRAHEDRFRRAPTVAFDQVAFSRASRGERAESDARAALATLADDEPIERAMTRGDVFPRGASFVPLRFHETAAAFGWDLARALDDAPLGHWRGPFASPFGWHLVRVRTRDAGGLPALSAVRDEVRRQWIDERRATLAREATDALVRRYTVVRP